MKENAIEQKSYAFAVRIVNLCRYLQDKKKEFVLSKQILKSGTSICANVSEAECGISDKDFLAKMYIAYKESAETKYWLNLLKDTGYLTKQEFTSLYKDCMELVRMLSSITKTIDRKLKV